MAPRRVKSSKKRWGWREYGVPRRPCGVRVDFVVELAAISTLSEQRGVLAEEQCIAVLKRLGGIELREIDARRVDSDLRKMLKMNNMHTTDRVLSTNAKLEAF